MLIDCIRDLDLGKTSVPKGTDQKDKRPTMQDIVPSAKPLVQKMGKKIEYTAVVETRICKDLYTKEVKTITEYIVVPDNLDSWHCPEPSNKFMYLVEVIAYGLDMYMPDYKLIWAKNTKPQQFCIECVIEQSIAEQVGRVSAKKVYSLEQLKIAFPLFEEI